MGSVARRSRRPLREALRAAARVALAAALASAVLASPSGPTAAGNIAILQGTVTDATTNQPIAGASVTLIDRTTGESETTRTKADGSYAMAVLLPASGDGLAVMATAPGYRGAFPYITLSAGNDTQSFALQPVPVLHLSGQVTDGQGAAVAGASVSVVSDLTGRTWTTTTDSQGAYSLDIDLPFQPQSAHLLVTAPGHEGRYEPITLSPGNETDSVVLGPAPVSDVSGRVTDPQGNAIAGATVEVISDQTGESVSATTASDGSYSLAVPLPVDLDQVTLAYHALVTAPGYVGSWQPLALSPGAVAYSATLSPSPTVTLTGSVTDAQTQAAIAGATVEVLSTYTGQTLATATTGADGSYSLTYPLPETQQSASSDPYALLVTAPNYVGSWLSAPDTAGTATLSAALTALPTNPTVLGTITGTVEDAHGNPVSGATVVFLNHDTSSGGPPWPVYGVATSGPDGSYSFPYLKGVNDSVPLDTFALSPGFPYACSGDCGGNYGWSGQNRTGVVLQLGVNTSPTYGDVSGTVTLGNSANSPPAPGATVLLLERPTNTLGPAVYGVTTANASGQYTFPDVVQPSSSGQYLDTLAIAPPYGEACDGDCGGHAAVGTSVTNALSTQSQEGAAKGSVLLSDGNPVVGAPVLLLDNSNGLGPEVYATTTTDNQGTYSFSITQPTSSSHFLDTLAYQDPYGTACDYDCGGHFNLSSTAANTVNTLGSTPLDGTSYGQVLLPNGAPAVGATVLLVDHSTTPWTVYGTAVTDANGVYRFASEAATGSNSVHLDTFAFLPGYGLGCFTDCGGHFTDAIWPPPGTQGPAQPITLSAASSPVQPLSQLTVTASPFQAPQGQAFSGVVAQFTDQDGNTDPSAYTATIDWGDGTTSPGNVSAAPGGGFEVSGSHTYASPGDFSVTVFVSDSDLAVGEATTLANPPTVTAVSPSQGPGSGGTVVTVTGQNLGGVTEVFFGPDNPGTNLTVDSPSQLTVTAPPGSGVVDVQVEDALTASAPVPQDRFSYLPVVTSVTPAAGGAAGGNRVTIQGAGLAGATAVDFGPGNPATDVTTVSANQLTVTTPPGSGTVDVTVTTAGGTSAVTPADRFQYVPLLFTSNTAAVDSLGAALAAWTYVLPAPGAGDDAGLSSPFTFAGVTFTLPYTQGEHVLFSQDPAGTQPFCVDGSWQIQLSGPATASLSGSGSMNGSTCVPSSPSQVVDLASLGLPSGTYGVEMTLTAPSSGTAYGTTDISLVLPPGAAPAANFAPVPGVGTGQVLRLQGQASLAVGQSDALAVDIAAPAQPVYGVHSVFGFDPSGIAVTGVAFPTGWSGGVRNNFANGDGGFSASGPPLLTGTVVTLSVRCLQPGTWPVSFSGNYWGQTGNGNNYAWSVSGAPTVTCTAPSSQASPTVTGVAIDPTDGSVTATLVASGLSDAASATLLGPGGQVVATSTSLTVDPGGDLMSAKFGPVPPGLYDMAVEDGAGNTLASTSGTPLEVAPAVPLFSFGPADLLNNVPGIPVAHIWNVANVGTVNGVAVMLFTFPKYVTAEPALTDAPPGTELLLHGLTAEGWAEYVAVPVQAGASVDLTFTVTLPPSAVFGPSPALSVGEPIPMVATLLGQFTAGEWATVSSDAPAQILALAVGEGAGDFTAALASLMSLSSTQLTTYTQGLTAADMPQMAQALDVAAQAVLDNEALSLSEQQNATTTVPLPVPSGEIPGPSPASVFQIGADALGDPLASSFAAFSFNTGEALASGATAPTLQNIAAAANTGSSVTGAAVFGPNGAPISQDALVPGDTVPYLAGGLTGVLDVPLAGASASDPPGLSIDATWDASATGVDPTPWWSAIGHTLQLNLNGTPVSAAVLPFFDPGQGSQAPAANVWQNINSNEKSIPPEMRQIDPVYGHGGEALHDLDKAAGEGASVSVTAVIADVVAMALTVGICVNPSTTLVCGVAIGVTGALIGGTFAALYYMHKAVTSQDPNAVEVSPSGSGPPGWVTPQPLTYRIRFENDPTATAPAYNIRITATLDPNLDPSTLEIGDPSQSSFSGTEVSYDAATRQITWYLPGIDLPPDTQPPNGEGWVSFTVSPLPGLASGTAITESAQVYFDYNPPVDTSPVTVTLDSGPPTVGMSPMSATEPAGPVSLSWSASSPVPIAQYQLFRSIDGGPLVPIESTAATSASVTVTAGHTYGFAVQATDVAGLSSPVPTGSQVSFAVPAPSSPPPPPPPPRPSTLSPPQGVTATAISSQAIRLSWQPVPGATVYTILRSGTPAGTFVPVGSTMQTGFTDSGLTPATTYVYEVEATGPGGSSSPSVPVSATTLSALPLPHRIILEAEPNLLPADGQTTARLTATVTTAAGQPVAGDEVDLSLSGTCGQVTARTVTTDAQGEATAVYRAARSAGRCEVVARESGTGSTVSLLIAQVRFDLTLTVQPAVLTAGSRSRATVVARVRSPAGKPVSEDRIRFTVMPVKGCGRLRPTANETGPGGQVAATYLAGPAATTCRIRAEEVATGSVAFAAVVQRSPGRKPPKGVRPIFTTPAQAVGILGR